MVDRSAQLSLGQFARAGFHELANSRAVLAELADSLGTPAEDLLSIFSEAADPDAALLRVTELGQRHPTVLRGLDSTQWHRLALLIGASPALGTYFIRHPERLSKILSGGGVLRTHADMRASLLDAVSAYEHESHPAGLGEAGLRDVGMRMPGPSEPGQISAERNPTEQGELSSRLSQPFLVAGLVAELGWAALRVRYRELLAEIMLWDLSHTADGGAAAAFTSVAAALSQLADATLETGLVIARATLLSGVSGPPVHIDQLAAIRFAVIAMGKCGAGELNVVSDVDVIFIADHADVPAEQAVSSEAMIRIGSRLATELMRAIHDPAIEPPLWEVDANLRPEGKQGALVRSLSSMLSYYQRWAKTWEFQALLKARPAAGDIALGAEFVSLVSPQVWASASREDFVGSVQRMRERVTEHIRDTDLDYQLKLGPGGLRDIEFSVQLLQLVHGQHDEQVRLAGTLPALEALVAGGYVARGDGEALAQDYRQLRVIEHRLQLRDLRRTALMPKDEPSLRVLARATGLARTADELTQLWEQIKLQVRRLHLKIFYAPLLGAVAALPDGGVALSGDGARARLQSIGFTDPDGALRHLAALSQGGTRGAQIQRNLLPVLLQWMAAGTDPDYGLLAFRRVSEANNDAPWYLRLLRDGSATAERLAKVLSSSRFTAELLETTPEAVAWLERDALMQPVELTALSEEMNALASRRDDTEDVAAALRAVHRREILRLALGRMTGVNSEFDVARGLDAAHTALLGSLLLVLLQDAEVTPAHGFQIALVGMGRYGGRELGFASDIDVIAVYRSTEDSEAAAGQQLAERLMTDLRRLVSDPRYAVDLDFDLRPEGKNGPLARSLEAYRSYYERWSLTWEAQALLRARAVVGDASLGADFIALADEIRYPLDFSEADIREVRRVKARVEAERLPQGADPKRHFKLGPGGLTDVEWLVQLLQLRFGCRFERLRTVSTLDALLGAEAEGLLDPQSRSQLTAAWKLASTLRSAVMLWSGRALDVLPNSRSDLEGIAGVLGMGAGRTIELEEQWFAATRRSRAVVEREFFGYTDEAEFPPR